MVETCEGLKDRQHRIHTDSIEYLPPPLRFLGDVQDMTPGSKHEQIRGHTGTQTCDLSQELVVGLQKPRVLTLF